MNAYEGLCMVLEVFNYFERSLPFNRTQFNEGFTIYGFSKSFTIYGFDFTPSGTSRGALTIIKQGNSNLSLKFRTALTEPIIVIAYLVFDATISINNQRQAMFDFSA